MEQTKITEENMQDLYKSVYNVLSLPKSSLFDLDLYPDLPILAVDSCGWHYKNVFSKNNILKVEAVSTAKNYQLSKNQFDKLFVDATSIKFNDDCVLLLDHCPAIFKYKNENELNEIFYALLNNISAVICLVRINTTTLDDNRFVDRFTNLTKIIPSNYVVVKFEYTLRELKFEIKRKVKI